MIKGIRYANAIFRLLSPVPFPHGKGRAGLKLAEPPDGGEGAALRAKRADASAGKLRPEFFRLMRPTDRRSVTGCVRGRDAAGNKEFASLMLFVDSYPPSPSHMGRGVRDKAGYAAYRRGGRSLARKARRRIGGKTPAGVFQTDASDRPKVGHRLRPGREARREIRYSLRSCYFSAPPQPLPGGEGTASPKLRLPPDGGERLPHLKVSPESS